MHHWGFIFFAAGYNASANCVVQINYANRP